MKTINVVAAVICKDGKFLATQRGYGEFKDWWEFPGGKIEPGESPEQALCREIKEELRVKISIDKYLTTIDYDYPQFHLHMYCYLCHIVDGSLTFVEAEDAQWLRPDKLMTVNWLPADVEIVGKLLDL